MIQKKFPPVHFGDEETDLPIHKSSKKVTQNSLLDNDIPDQIQSKKESDEQKVIKVEYIGDQTGEFKQHGITQEEYEAKYNINVKETMQHSQASALNINDQAKLQAKIPITLSKTMEPTIQIINPPEKSQPTPNSQPEATVKIEEKPKTVVHDEAMVFDDSQMIIPSNYHIDKELSKSILTLSTHGIDTVGSTITYPPFVKDVVSGMSSKEMMDHIQKTNNPDKNMRFSKVTQQAYKIDSAKQMGALQIGSFSTVSTNYLEAPKNPFDYGLANYDQNLTIDK